MVEEYHKLVRDRVPTVVRADGDRPVTRRADDEEYARLLGEKLVEEAVEYRESRDVEELADVLEVLAAIRALEAVDEDGVEAMRREKAAERGGFEGRVVLEKVVPGEGDGDRETDDAADDGR